MSIPPRSVSVYEQCLLDQSPFPIPSEPFSHLFPYLDQMDIQQFSMVSQEAFAMTINETNFQMFFQLRTFIHSITSKLSDENATDQKIALEQIPDAMENSFPNLDQVKKYLLNAKRQVVNILGTLREEEITRLKEIPIPAFFEDVFEIAVICSLASQIKEMESQEHRDKMLQQACVLFIKAGEIERAIELSSSITPELRQRVTERFALVMQQTGNIEAANRFLGEDHGVCTLL